MANEEKIVVRQVQKPQKENVDTLVSWFLKSLDLSEKDDSLEPEMLKEIVGANREGSGITSLELHARLETPRTTVIYHLNRFISSGLVVRRGRKYFLRATDMESTFEEMQADMMREFNRMMEFAEKFDQMIVGDIHGRKQERKGTKPGK
ncbi:MAG: helix-turn-helix transcriptional regulator [Candidatus Micrarchaeota archaeon]|nr:helix-turn-helix transcriptional regulator [Candidatus Micrarchaeota archaeon]MDE1847808.1 helix-turn-helix transcriptional regulator [Candidatus Micrarchaeota archaeon]MDE1864246.1 helix-turn-helix transcriptional regulator [Candidatus Micrarchaeota archaeon]